MERDEVRYIEKVREALTKKLPEVVLGGDILSAPPQAKYRIRLPYVEVPYLRRARPGGGGGGSGSGQGAGGDGEGEPHVVVELSLEELTEILFTLLRLPRIKPKKGESLEETWRVQGVSPTGPRSRLHLPRTLKEHLKVGSGEVYPSLFRYRGVRPRELPQLNAVVVLVRDSSGSVDENMRYRVKVAAYWTLLWLRKNYPRVETRFVLYDTKALETNEKDFFQLEKGGGTKTSTGLALAKEILERYPAPGWNRYVLLFSDGDNWAEDNRDAYALTEELVNSLEALIYGEVHDVRGRLPSPFFQGLKRRGARAAVLDEPGEWIREVFGQEVDDA